jgi:cytochrome c peroxidase
MHRRNAMSLANVAYNGTFNWADATTASLEEQMRVPMFSLEPIELGLTGHEEETLRALAAEPRYPPLFAAAFPGEQAPIHFDNVIRAIATFERSLVSADSPYDRFVRGGDRDALSAAARRGMVAFFSSRLGCSECHHGVHLAGNATWYGRPPSPFEFHNTGLYNLTGGAYPASDRGRFESTARAEDMGRFRAPTLRNVALTAPFCVRSAGYAAMSVAASTACDSSIASPRTRATASKRCVIDAASSPASAWRSRFIKRRSSYGIGVMSA